MNFDNLVAYITSKYNCHTVILYGSYSKGNFDSESDIDVVGFTSLDLECQDKSTFEGKALDLWIYNDTKINLPNEFLHIHSGNALLDEHGHANFFLSQINECLDKGPEPKSKESKLNTIIWLEKMLNRALKKDTEGMYRLNWLLTELLPIYFEVVDQYYLGSKAAFEWLKVNDPEVFHKFEKVYQQPTKVNIEQLIISIKEKVI